MAGLFGKDVAGRIASRVIRDEVDFDDDEELFSMSVRVPASLRALVDELAESAGLSRNAMCVDLIQAGVEDVISRLPAEVANDVHEAAAGRL